MIRSLLPLLAIVPMAGCMTPPAPSAGCNADGVQGYVGQRYTADLARQVRQRSGSDTLRAVAPGMAVTMEFNPNRVTIAYDESQTVTRITCG
jgi:hypothetical protein